MRFLSSAVTMLLAIIVLLALVTFPTLMIVYAIHIFTAGHSPNTMFFIAVVLFSFGVGMWNAIAAAIWHAVKSAFE